MQSAAFGAFLPWAPLGTVEVPSLLPGERRVVRAAFDTPELRAWAARERCTAKTAGRRQGVKQGLEQFFGNPQQLRRLFGASHAGTDVHLVGNINVFVNRGRPTERHVPTRIGLKPRATNVSAFFVGNGKLATYTFEVRDCDVGWQIKMVGMAAARTTSPVGILERSESSFAGTDGRLVAARARVFLAIPPRRRPTRAASPST